MNEYLNSIIKRNGISFVFVNGAKTIIELKNDGYDYFDENDTVIEMFSDNDVCYYRLTSGIGEIQKAIDDFKEFKEESADIDFGDIQLLFGDTPWGVYETKNI